jgi:putative protein kinase ArgK-like GTPase of G3E family
MTLMTLTYNMLVELLARKESHIRDLESRVKCQAERLEGQKAVVEAIDQWDRTYTAHGWRTEERDAKTSRRDRAIVAVLKAYEQYKDVLNEPNSTDAGGTTETGMESAGGGEVDSPDPHPL